MQLSRFHSCLLSGSLKWMTVKNNRRAGPRTHRQSLLLYYSICQQSYSKTSDFITSYKKQTRDQSLLAIPTRILALPTLYSFPGDMMRQSDLWQTSPPNSKAFIKNLKLQRYSLSSTTLVNLVSSCPKLEFLKFETIMTMMRLFPSMGIRKGNCILDRRPERSHPV